MLKGVACAAVLALVSSSALADPVADCHRLAAHPTDAGRVGEGVAFEAIDAPSAIIACLQAVDANPKDGRLAYQLGRAFDSAGDFPSAQNAYLRAADLHFALAERNLGKLYAEIESMKDLRKAEKFFRAALKHGDSGSANELAWILAIQDRHLREALKFARQAVAADPADAESRDTLAWVLHLSGDNDLALAEMRAVVAAQPDEADFQAHLGWIHDALGHTAGARAAFERALALPQEPAAHDVTYDAAAITARLEALKAEG